MQRLPYKPGFWVGGAILTQAVKDSGLKPRLVVNASAFERLKPLLLAVAAHPLITDSFFFANFSYIGYFLFVICFFWGDWLFAPHKHAFVNY